jgi:hypothetical protein
LADPVTNVDPTGYDSSDAIRKAATADPVAVTQVLVKNPALRASTLSALGDRMPKSVEYTVSNHEKLAKRQALFREGRLLHPGLGSRPWRTPLQWASQPASEGLREQR